MLICLSLELHSVHSVINKYIPELTEIQQIMRRTDNYLFQLGNIATKLNALTLNFQAVL